MKRYKVSGLTLIVLLAGCTGLQAPKVANVHTYVLDAQPAISERAIKRDQVIAVSMPTSRSGFDTPRMAYRQQPLELDYFATHQWADTPAHMLQPLLVQALEPAFRAVVKAPGMIPADLKLDTDIIRLQQNFITHPDTIELKVRAQLTDVKNSRIIATRIFETTESTRSADAYGGVIAANLALQRILTQLTEFCLDVTAIP